MFEIVHNSSFILKTNQFPSLYVWEMHKYSNHLLFKLNLTQGKVAFEWEENESVF